MLLLSACKVEVDHFINDDGSSILQFAVGDEIEPDDGESITCETEPEDGLVVAYSNLEQRGSETWCTTGIVMETPRELASFYARFNEEGEFARVNCLSVNDGHLVYDIELLIEPAGIEDGDSLLWRVTAPGEIVSTNADSQSGNTVTWDLTRRSGWVSMQVNSDGVDCPTADFAIDLIADSATSGNATIFAAKPSTREADGVALAAALARQAAMGNRPEALGVGVISRLATKRTTVGSLRRS